MDIAKGQTENLSKALVQSGGTRNTVEAFKSTLGQWWIAKQPDISRLAGSPEEAKRVYSTLMHVIQKNPALLECTMESIFDCLMNTATLRLYPGPMNECAYVPLRNSKKECKEANFWMQYPGIIKLALNSGFVRKIKTAVVYEDEIFEYEEGVETHFRHVPSRKAVEQRGQRIGVYALLVTRYDEIVVEFLNPDQVMRIKNGSPGAQKSDSPWNNSNPYTVNWMWRKTAVKQALKEIPKSAELALALELDNATERPDLAKSKVIDMGFIDPPQPAPAQKSEAKKIEAAPAAVSPSNQTDIS